MTNSLSTESFATIRITSDKWRENAIDLDRYPTIDISVNMPGIKERFMDDQGIIKEGHRFLNCSCLFIPVRPG